MFIGGVVFTFFLLFALLLHRSSKLRQCNTNYSNMSKKYEEQKEYSSFLFDRFSEQTDCITTYDNSPEQIKSEINLSTFCIVESY